MTSPNSGTGYDKSDREKGGNGYMPISLQYNNYTATYARNPSLAGGDPFENFTNRSYKGKSVKTANKQDMLSVLETKAKMKGKPVIVSLKMDKPTIMSEFEGSADAILVNFGVQNQAVLDIISGKSRAFRFVAFADAGRYAYRGGAIRGCSPGYEMLYGQRGAICMISLLV